jgi:sucrose-6-phosphate hydrolase SacC (GH32 family)
MHWGHAVSKDLIHWEHLPIALHPDEHGMIFSGSAVIDWHNTAGFGKQAMVAIFTYNKDYIETQNLAYSTDRGRTWTKYAGNPVIPHPAHLKDIRDPKVFWHNDHWVMLLAAGDCILFYTSTNLKDWQASGTFGNGYGCTSGVWETPDLFQLPLTASDSRWVLTVGRQGFHLTQPQRNNSLDGLRRRFLRPPIMERRTTRSPHSAGMDEQLAIRPRDSRHRMARRIHPAPRNFSHPNRCRHSVGTTTCC